MATDDQKDNHNNFGLPNTTFKPIEPSKTSQWLKVTAIIMLIVLIMSTGVVYWLFKRSSSSYHDFVSKALKKQSVASKEQLVQDPYPEADHAKEFMDLEQEQAKQGFVEFVPEEKVNPTQMRTSTVKKAIQEIDVPQGLYYVIIASYIDKDLAMDYAKKLIKNHPYVTLIAPAKQKYFYRLAIEEGTTEQEALAKAEILKQTYGSQLWVMKY